MQRQHYHISRRERDELRATLTRRREEFAARRISLKRLMASERRLRQIDCRLAEIAAVEYWLTRS
jgi:hypothetical protein